MAPRVLDTYIPGPTRVATKLACADSTSATVPVQGVGDASDGRRLLSLALLSAKMDINAPPHAIINYFKLPQAIRIQEIQTQALQQLL